MKWPWMRIYIKVLASQDIVKSLLITKEKSLKIHEWERYGYSHLFSMNWEKISPYIGKSMETSLPYLGIAWVLKFIWFLFKAHGMRIY